MQICITSLCWTSKGISLTGMSYIEGNNPFSVIRVNEIVMGLQIRTTSIMYFTVPQQGSFYKQPASLIEM